MMTSRIVDTIYGTSLSDIEEQISSSVVFDGPVALSSNLLEGWSSLNFIGSVNDVPKFIVKFPPTRGGTDFTRLFLIHESLAPHGICSRPLYRGFLEADGKIPFIILEYIEGTIHSNPNDIKGHLFKQLTETLHRLNQIDLPMLHRNKDGNDYVNQMMSSLNLRRKRWKTKFDTQLSSRLNQFLFQVEDVQERLVGMLWEPVTVHGDLYEANIVFQPGRAMLLDLDECCVA
ncbi:MAG: aminoglycoside phosphotransferase family protein, partial [Candidatus Thorarchaeota archaeon]